MKTRTVALCCLSAMLLPLYIAVAAPPKERAPGALPPPKAVATPTPMTLLVRQPLTLAACSAVATLTADAAYNAAHNLAVQYVGPMTFTANRDLWAVTLYTMNYDEGHGWAFLGGCTCPQFPKGGDNPATAPPNTNFKRLESRTYQLSCAWPTGGLPQTGPFRFKVNIIYFLKDATGAWQKKAESCGTLTPTN